MGTKGVPFAYLKFPRAIRGNHARERAAGGRSQARVAVSVWNKPLQPFGRICTSRSAINSNTSLKEGSENSIDSSALIILWRYWL